MTAQSWPGVYQPDPASESEPVTVLLLETGLYIQRDGGDPVFWPAHAVLRHPPEFTRGNERLRVEDPVFTETLRRGPQPGASWVTPTAVSIIVGTLVLLVAAIAGGLYLLFRVAPALLTEIVPVSWEERLGRATVNQMVPEASRCSDDQLTAAIDGITNRLEPADSPYRFHVIVADDPAVNAFAAPGGWLVFNRGLLRKTRTPEELAAVMAHEMQHVLQRHTTNGIMRQLSWRAAFALLIGDAGGAGDLLYAAGALRELGYQRGDEESADREGLRLLGEARVDPHAMTSMLTMLEKESEGMPQPLVYLSSHPNTADRRARIEELARAMRSVSEPLLRQGHWQDLSARCR